MTEIKDPVPAVVTNAVESKPLPKAPAARLSPGAMLGALVRADFTIYIRSTRNLALTILLPVIILVISLKSRNQNADIITLLISMAITYGLIASSMLEYAVKIATDRENGIFRRLRITPAHSSLILISRVIVYVVVSIILSIVVAILGGLLHHLNFSFGQYCVLVVVSVLGTLMFIAIAHMLCGLLKSSSGVITTSRLVMIALVIFGVLGLSGQLGRGFETFSRWTPLGALTDVIKSTLNQLTWTSADTVGIIACVVYTVVCGAIGACFFRWDDDEN